MLAGLLFAIEDAVDRPDVLAATLPFGGASLIEFQARLLIAAGAVQIMIAVARVTPELLGAANRIGRRGVAVDIVRTAAEAAAKVHPLARVVVLADGLVTTETMIAPFVGEGGDMLLVTEGDDGLERIDAGGRWAGIGRVGAQRLAEVAAMPRDYDFLSTLLRVTAQAGAARLLVTAGSERAGHGIERDGQGLARRGRGVFADLAGTRVPWVDRWLFAPVARVVLPALIARGASPAALLAVGGVVSLTGLAGIWAGWTATGLFGASVGGAGYIVADMLAWLRGDDAEAKIADYAAAVIAAAAMALAGYGEDVVRGTATGSVLAVALIVAAVLVARITGLVGPRRWWASPAAYPVLLIPFAALGQTMTGLAALALYAALTLLGGIEDARAQP